MICQFGDVVVVRFPFTDLSVTKPRPAVAVSSLNFSADHGHTILAMITTGAGSTWPSDVRIDDLAAAGLQHPSVIRWKPFTLVNEQLAVLIGRLAEADRARLIDSGVAVLGR